MSKEIVWIPLGDIARIQIYINRQGKSLDKIMRETGADYGMNGGLFEGSRAVCHLKADGYINASDEFTYWGYAWDTGPDIGMQVIPMATAKNYISCVELIRDKKPNPKPIYNTDVGGKRGRTTMGLKDGCLCMYVTGDGTADAKTPEALRDELVAMGWESSVMLDGGGSSQCDFAGQRITSSRAVHNLILVYLKKEGTTVDGITKRYMTRNRCYTNQVKCTKAKGMLHSTGTPGAMAAAIIAAMDKPEAGTSVEFVIDDTGIYQTLPMGVKSWHSGASANLTHVACEICEPIQTRVLSVNWKTLSRGGKDNTAYAVTLLQKELAARGFDPKGIDGSFGPGTEAALRAYQKAAGLTVDGSCGQATLMALQGLAGSFLRYPVAEVQAYFDNVYSKAVALYAWIMKEVGGKPAEILCHSEGYQVGIASNHADVLHWFPQHGKTMDDFRRDVTAAMAGKPSEPPATEVLPEAVKWALDNGIIVADGSALSKEQERTCTMFHRFYQLIKSGK